MTEVERPALTALLNRIGPEDRRDAAAAEAAERQLAAPLAALDAALAASPYLLGQRFSAADLNVASILSWARQARGDLSPFAKTEAWLKACHDRPAAGRRANCRGKVEPWPTGRPRAPPPRLLYNAMTVRGRLAEVQRCPLGDMPNWVEIVDPE
jgi:glutathione S-transferase